MAVGWLLCCDGVMISGISKKKNCEMERIGSHTLASHLQRMLDWPFSLKLDWNLCDYFEKCGEHAGGEAR